MLLHGIIKSCCYAVSAPNFFICLHTPNKFRRKTVTASYAVNSRNMFCQYFAFDTGCKWIAHMKSKYNLLCKRNKQTDLRINSSIILVGRCKIGSMIIKLHPHAELSRKITNKSSPKYHFMV